MTCSEKYPRDVCATPLLSAHSTSCLGDDFCCLVPEVVGELARNAMLARVDALQAREAVIAFHHSHRHVVENFGADVPKQSLYRQSKQATFQRMENDVNNHWSLSAASVSGLD